MQESTWDESGTESSTTACESSGIHEDLASWKAILTGGELASVRHSVPVLQPRASPPAGLRLSTTAFDTMSHLGESLTGQRKCQTVPVRNRENSMPPAPTNMEEIE